jgi:hypothetical protein
MGSRWAERARPILRPGSLLVMALAAAQPAAAQRVVEPGVAAIATAADPAVVVAGGTVGLRTSTRTRISATLAAGASDGAFAWRGELLGHFLLSPARLRGVGLYGGGGVALAGGPVDQGYLVLTLGLEQRPGGRRGWFVETGVGGGARLAAGYRWRRGVR